MCRRHDNSQQASLRVFRHRIFSSRKKSILAERTQFLFRNAGLLAKRCVQACRKPHLNNMEIIDCSCKGINPTCEKCFGRGYYDTSLVQDDKYFSNIPLDKPREIKATFTEEISKLNGDEIESFAEKLIEIIDSKSKKQFQLFSSLFRQKWKKQPSKDEIFERKNLYAMINNLESDKIFFKGKLQEVVQQAIMVNRFIEPIYKHSLSKIEIDTSSKIKLQIVKKMIRNKRGK